MPCFSYYKCSVCISKQVVFINLQQNLGTRAQMLILGWGRGHKGGFIFLGWSMCSKWPPSPVLPHMHSTEKVVLPVTTVAAADKQRCFWNSVCFGQTVL